MIKVIAQARTSRLCTKPKKINKRKNIRINPRPGKVRTFKPKTAPTPTKTTKTN